MEVSVRVHGPAGSALLHLLLLHSEAEKRGVEHFAEREGIPACFSVAVLLEQRRRGEATTHCTCLYIPDHLRAAGVGDDA